MRTLLTLLALTDLALMLFVLIGKTITWPLVWLLRKLRPKPKGTVVLGAFSKLLKPGLREDILKAYNEQTKEYFKLPDPPPSIIPITQEMVDDPMYDAFVPKNMTIPKMIELEYLSSSLVKEEIDLEFFPNSIFKNDKEV